METTPSDIETAFTNIKASIEDDVAQTGRPVSKSLIQVCVTTFAWSLTSQEKRELRRRLEAVFLHG